LPQTKTVSIITHDKNNTENTKHIVIGNMDQIQIFHNINDAVIRTNQIMIKTYLVLRCWVLSKYYQQQGKIPLISTDIISAAIKSVCLPKDTSGKIRKEETVSLIKEFQELHSFTVEDDSHLSGIFNYQETTILTNIENNVKAHFPEYLRKYINIVMEHLYPERLIDKDSKKQFYSEIKQIKNDLLMNRIHQKWTCNQMYHKWIHTQRSKILPVISEEDSYYYDVHVDPQKYLPYMIYMNNEIDQLKGSMFQFFPLQTDVIPKHIPIDTKSLIELLVDNGCATLLSNIGSCQDALWQTYFNIPQQRGEYIFDHTIVTDGYSSSIRMVHHQIMAKNKEKNRRMAEGRARRRDLQTLQPKEKEKKQKKKGTRLPRPPEFSYIDEVESTHLEGNHFFCDPGKDRLLSVIGDNESDEYFSYSNRQRLGQTKRLKYQRVIHNHRIKQGIQPIEEELSGYNSKTCDLTFFRVYMIKKIENNRRICDLYADPKYRQYKWYGYLNRMRCDDQLINHLQMRLESNCSSKVNYKSKKHRHKKKKTQLIRKEIRHMDTHLKKDNSCEKIQKKKEKKIHRLKDELGLRQTLKPCLHLKKQSDVKEDLNMIESIECLISQANQKLNLLEHDIRQSRHRIWSLKKKICQLKRSMNPILEQHQPIHLIDLNEPIHPDHNQQNRPIIIMGDWSVGKQMRGMISTPNMRLKRRLARIFPLYLVDEFRTSCLHHKTEGRCTNLILPDATNHLRKIHAILTYQTETNCLACINRDNNGCRNIRKLFRYYLETGGRPERYVRGVEI